jgi:predicted ArsR family transcriptional regulator
LKKRQLVKVNQDMYARLLKMLLDDPITAHELAEETGMHIITAQSLMRTMKKHHVVHVCAWEADRLGRDVTPVYKLGGGKDKARHKFTAAERQARYRAKKTNIAALLSARSIDGHSDNRL